MSPRPTGSIFALVVVALAARAAVTGWGCPGGALSAGIGAPAQQDSRPVDRAPPGHPTPADTPTVPPPARDPFLPSRHGFHFTNSFRGSPLPKDLGALGATLSTSLKLPSHFGLCGGMCFAAHDNYLADRVPPPETTPPESGTPLYERIYARQADSIGPGITQATRFAEWMGLEDDGRDGTRTRTLRELPAILDRLSRGELVHIGLVHVSFRETREIWHNHQVLAYAVAQPDPHDPHNPPTPGVVDLRIYDPNHPGRDDIAIRLRLVRVEPPSVLRIGLAFHAPPALGLEGSLIATDGTVLKNVRGLFAMPYDPQQPRR